MVLEAIVSPGVIRKRPGIMMLYSIVLSSVGIWIAFYTFPASSSVLSLAFVTVGLVPLMRHLFQEEEAMEVSSPGPAGRFVYRHFHLIKIFSFFFIGLIISYTFWYTVLPATVPPGCETGAVSGFSCMLPGRDAVFQEQEAVWNDLSRMERGSTVLVKRGNVANAVSPASCLEGGKEFWGCTWFILSHNTEVLVFAVIFSVLYGTGAVFLLSWNASVIALFIGKEILSRSLAEGMIRAVSYLPHGIFEISGYFAGAIAGAIVSVLICKQQHKSREVGIILRDVGMMFILGLILLLIGAMVEAACLVSGLCF